MPWYDPFLLGPVGAMRALPSPPHGSEVKVVPVRRGGVREPLLGPPVGDVWSIRRRYEFEWPEAYAEQLVPIRRAWHNLDRRPRRLLDPMHGPNLLTLDASFTGAYSRTLKAFDAGSRPMVYVPSLDLPAALDGASGLLRWSVPENTADAVRADLGRPVPVLGRPVCVSLFARGAGQVAAQYEPVAADGVSSAGAAARGAFVALTAAWQRLSVTLPAGAAFPGLTAALAVASGAARTVETCGWQAEHALTPSAFGDGGGCPRVRLDDLDPGYKRGNRRRIALVLGEV